MNLFGKKRLEWFWIGFPAPGLRMQLPDLPATRQFRWRGIYGLQVGPWFIGCINGKAESPPPASPGRSEG